MQTLALALIGLSAAFTLAMGVRYITARQFMPYHATVVGKPWTELDLRLQSFIRGLLKVSGGGLLGYGFALLWLLLPLQRGEEWAAWAALTISAAMLSPMLFTAAWLRRIEPSAKTPIVPTFIILALVVTGAVVSLLH